MAITTRRVPTLSHLTWRYPPLGLLLLAGLAAHFYLPHPPTEGDPTW